MIYIIVPYRDRESNLRTFIERVPEYLDRNNIKYIIIIAEQDDNKIFNRGLIKNIGFKFVVDNMNTDDSYFCFHDIDIIPNYETNNIKYDDPKNEVIHQYGLDFCLGCMFICSKDNFIKANGFPNNYWGYGMEDCTMQMRFNRKDIRINRDKFIERYSTKDIIELDHETPETNIEEDKNNKILWEKEKEDIKIMYNNGINGVRYNIKKFECIKNRIFMIKFGTI